MEVLEIFGIYCWAKEPGLVDRTPQLARELRKSSLKTEMRAFFNCHFFECTLKDTLTAKTSGISS